MLLENFFINQPELLLFCKQLNLADQIEVILEKVKNGEQKAEEASAQIQALITQKQRQNEGYDYIIVNYANPDMVGHTGDIAAGIQSMEFLDEQLGRLLEVIEKDDHQMILIADHGNMEFVGAFEENGKMLTDTEHNADPVPCVVVSGKWKVTPPASPEPLDREYLEQIRKKGTLGQQQAQVPLSREYFPKIRKKGWQLEETGVIQNLQSFSTQNTTNPDLELIQEVLAQQNQIDLSNLDTWLTENQIPQAKWPLWYAGSLLLAL